MSAASCYVATSCMFLAVLLLLVETGQSIRCYQCNSTSSEYPFQCNEFLSSDIDLHPESCDDVYGAQYCVKHIGRFEAMALDCYQCTSENEWKCMDSEMVKSSLVPMNCSHVFAAHYCIKSIGRYGGSYVKILSCRVCMGGIGTKRFCSSVHMGNYCDYVKQPGDKLTYRTCVFTCSEDGCNSATSFVPNVMHTWLIPASLVVTWRKLFYR